MPDGNDNVNAQLNELKRSIQSDMREMKQGFDSSITELKQTLKDINTKLNENKNDNKLEEIQNQILFNTQRLMDIDDTLETLNQKVLESAFEIPDLVLPIP